MQCFWCSYMWCLGVKLYAAYPGSDSSPWAALGKEYILFRPRPPQKISRAPLFLPRLQKAAAARERAKFYFVLFGNSSFLEFPGRSFNWNWNEPQPPKASCRRGRDVWRAILSSKTPLINKFIGNPDLFIGPKMTRVSFPVWSANHPRLKIYIFISSLWAIFCISRKHRRHPSPVILFGKGGLVRGSTVAAQKPLSLHYEGEIPESNQINERGSTFEKTNFVFLFPLITQPQNYLEKRARASLEQDFASVLVVFSSDSLTLPAFLLPA